jgi:hypothetical protein
MLAMAAAVWTLYAADRLLDAQSARPDTLETRHHFHHRHRIAFLAGIGCSSILLAVVLPHIPQEAIHLYLVLGGLVFGYFILIHATQSAHRLPKEIAVGVCFAAAVFIPTVSRTPALRPMLLTPALLFAAVCSLNCLFIYTWEHPSPASHIPHAVTAFALNHLPSFTIAIAAASATLTAFDRALWPVYAAIAASAAILLLLHLRRKRHLEITLRTAADLALLTPALFIGFL